MVTQMLTMKHRSRVWFNPAKWYFGPCGRTFLQRGSPTPTSLASVAWTICVDSAGQSLAVPGNSGGKQLLRLGLSSYLGWRVVMVTVSPGAAVGRPLGKIGSAKASPPPVVNVTCGPAFLNS